MPLELILLKDLASGGVNYIPSNTHAVPFFGPKDDLSSSSDKYESKHWVIETKLECKGQDLLTTLTCRMRGTPNSTFS